MNTGRHIRKWLRPLLERRPLQGLATTIRLSFWSLLFALPIGLTAGLLRTSRHVFNRLLGGTFVLLLRNLPPLVLVLIFYFFLSDQILPLLGIGNRLENAPPWLQQFAALMIAPAHQIEAFVAAVMTMALLEGAYKGEIIRAGINAVETGQWEAAKALGMKRRELLRYVILPQAFRKMIPPPWRVRLYLPSKIPPSFP